MTALRQGAQAYIQKDMQGDSILAAVRQTLKGERVVAQPAAMTAALTELSELLRARERDQSQLTPRELEILRLAAAGHKNKDIGARMFLSEVSIKRKMLDIYRKLNVSGKPAAVAEAMRLGLI
jgi:DNA-binding NarL/FixJ family response regulator